MKAEGDVLGGSQTAARMGDLILGALVLELEDAAGEGERSQTSGGRRGFRGEWADGMYRLGSMDFPAALLLSFFMAMGPMFIRWSAEGLVMMVSQMTAELETFPWGDEEEGQSAVT